MSSGSKQIRVGLFGPPAAGKSIVLSRLLATGRYGLEHMNLDDDVIALSEEGGLTGPLTDEVIDRAVSRLFSRARGARSAVVELPHHDYVQLLEDQLLRLEDFDHLVVVTAPLPILLHRNGLRQFQVPDPYITRCYGATAALIEHLDRLQMSWVLLDSDLLRPQVMAELVDDLIRREVSPDLAKLEVVPVPRAPYLGGHLATDIEWSSELVSKLLGRWPLHTALDVGCGLGLTLDRFAELGVACWGVEGNLRVLDGPCRRKERLFIVDFQKQWVELPGMFDLIWCVEVLEHIPTEHEENVVQTIVRNSGRLAVVSAAATEQPGYFHVNCRPREYWVERFEAAGLRHVSEADDIFHTLEDGGAFGVNALKRNGFLLEVQ